MNATEQLQDLLQLEQLDTYLFRGITPPENEMERVFGGQVFAQALNAAVRTVPKERLMHSMHSYFLRPGDINKPILFEVDPIRDGGSFTTRRVVAKQQGEAIFNATASFKTPEEGFEANDDMPDVDPPETLQTDEERYQTPELVNRGIKVNKADAFRCFDIRTPGELPFLAKKGHPAIGGFWFKPKQRLEADFSSHQVTLAYLSDIRLLFAAVMPIGYSELKNGLIMASIDHSLWVHSNFDINDWHYYHHQGPVSAGGCGLNFGHVYTREGKLVASTSQQGLMRYKRD